MTKDVFSKEFFKSGCYIIIIAFIIFFSIFNGIYVIWYLDTLFREGKSRPEYGIIASIYLYILIFAVIIAFAMPKMMEEKKGLSTVINFFLEFIIVLILLGNVITYFFNLNNFVVFAFSGLALPFVIFIFLLKMDYFFKKSNRLSNMKDMHYTLNFQLNSYSEDIKTINRNNYIIIILNGKIIALKIEPLKLNIEEIIHFKCLIDNSGIKNSVMKKIMLYRDHGWQDKKEIKKFRLIAKNEYNIIILTTKNYKSTDELIAFLNKISRKMS